MSIRHHSFSLSAEDICTLYNTSQDYLAMAEQHDDRRQVFKIIAGLVAAVCIGIIAIDLFVYAETTSLVLQVTIAVSILYATLRIKYAGVRRFLVTLTSAQHRQSMETNFQRTVKLTADVIHQDQGKASSMPPESGTYEVDVRELAIMDRKTNNLLYGGFSDPSVLTIQLKRVEEPNGWSIQGTRKSKGKAFYAITDGFLAPSGKAYWVETSSHQSLLVYGEYFGSQFCGEWLSSSGDRGRYTDFQHVKLLEAYTSIVLTDAPQPSEEEHLIVML